MFKFSAICVLAIGSAAATAGEYQFINADGSALGQLCIAAAEAPGKDSGTRSVLAAELGVDPPEAAAVSCNGVSLASFARKYGASKPTGLRSYSIYVADNALESQLCVASVVSAEEFAKLKELHFKDIAVEQEILCNGMPMTEFVEKYRAKQTFAPRRRVDVAAR